MLRGSVLLDDAAAETGAGEQRQRGQQGNHRRGFRNRLDSQDSEIGVIGEESVEPEPEIVQGFFMVIAERLGIRSDAVTQRQEVVFCPEGKGVHFEAGRVRIGNQRCRSAQHVPRTGNDEVSGRPDAEGVIVDFIEAGWLHKVAIGAGISRNHEIVRPAGGAVDQLDQPDVGLGVEIHQVGDFKRLQEDRGRSIVGVV